MSIRRMMLFTLGGFFKSIISLFKTRVLSDDGNFEAETNLENQLNTLGSDLFNSASLVITPNGVKTSKLYSIKPSDGTGDLSVTRATTATRVNKQGLIETVPYNLFQQSETFDNGYWTKLGSYTLIPNATIAPDGTLTADLFTKTGAINTVTTIITTSPYTTTGAYTLSFYCKQNVGDKVGFRIDAGGNSCNCLFNFTTKTLTNTGANVISSSYEELPDGWFRLILVGNVIATNWSADIANLFSNPLNDSVFVWGAQLVEGTQPKDYFPTIDRLNVARIDYSTGQPAILVEPQRTNLVYPSDIATTQVRAVTAQVYTLSLYGTGTVTLSGAFSGSLAGTGTKNRVSLTFTPTAGNLTLTVSGSVTNWQLEAGSYETSYIPTVSGSVTRNADNISKDGISNLIGQTEGSVYVEVNINNLSVSSNIFQLSFDGSNRFAIQDTGLASRVLILSNQFSGTSFNFTRLTLGVNKVCLIYQNGTWKIFRNGVLAGQQANGIYTSPLTIINVGAGGSPLSPAAFLNGCVKELVLYKTALTDEQAIQLTTL